MRGAHACLLGGGLVRGFWRGARGGGGCGGRVCNEAAGAHRCLAALRLLFAQPLASGTEEEGKKRGERVKPGEGRPEKRTDHGGVGGSWPWGQCFLIRAGRTMRWGGQWGA